MAHAERASPEGGAAATGGVVAVVVGGVVAAGGACLHEDDERREVAPDKLGLAACEPAKENECVRHDCDEHQHD